MSEGRWVFGYGSLLWRPGFEFVERRSALLRGYHRAFCIYSTRYRGTPMNPGLVLGLCTGGNCIGQIFRVTETNWPSAKAYLDEREMVDNVYIPSDVVVETDSHGPITAHTYIANPDCESYAGHLTLETQAHIITGAFGAMGPNLDYLENTVDHLDGMGIIDPPLHDLMDLVRREYGEINQGADI